MIVGKIVLVLSTTSYPQKHSEMNDVNQTINIFMKVNVAIIFITKESNTKTSNFSQIDRKTLFYIKNRHQPKPKLSAES